MEKIALLPGSFKPPHAGHYNMVKWLATNTDADTIVVKVGSGVRDGITREMSLKLWNLYRTSDPDSTSVTILPSDSNSPVRDVYDFIEKDAPEGSTIYLGMGEKDINDKRFQNIYKYAEPKGIKFKTVLVPPQAGGVSGTEMRGFINNEDKKSFQKYLPDHLTFDQEDEAWDIVSSLKEDFYDPRNKTYDFAKSSEWKAGMPDGHKDDIPRKGDQIHNRQTAPVSWEESLIKESKRTKTKIKYKVDPDLGGVWKLDADGFVITLDADVTIEHEAPNMDGKYSVDALKNVNIRYHKTAWMYLDFKYDTLLKKEKHKNTEVSGADYTDYEYIVFSVERPLSTYVYGRFELKVKIQNDKEKGNLYKDSGILENIEWEDIRIIYVNKMPKTAREKIANEKPGTHDVSNTPSLRKYPNKQIGNPKYGQYSTSRRGSGSYLKENQELQNEQQGGRTLRVYDFDDTLAVTRGANIKVKHTDGTIDTLDPAEFATYKEQPGDKFDFTEFDSVIKEATPIQHIVDMLKRDVSDASVDKVTILTARLLAYPVKRYIREDLGLDVYVVAVGSSDPLDKATWIEDHILKGYNDIMFIDDSEPNRKAVKALKDTHPDIKLEVYHPNELSEAMYGMMTRAEKRKHKKTLKKIKRGLKKYQKKNRYFEVPKSWRGSLTRKYKRKRRKKRKLRENATAVINNHSIPLEIMDTPELQVQGMSGRDKLEGGMVFPYNDVDKREFHMQDCKIPLDIIFIINNKINSISHNCPPCQEKKCPKYSGTADTVLELPGGYCKENNINIEDHIGINSYEMPEYMFSESKKEPPALTKKWWAYQFKQILTEGGAAGHMAHPFNLPNVNSGKDLKDIFNKAANSLQNDPGSVKIDGVNSSIRLIDLDGTKQFVMDRGSKKELDVRGITKADLEDRFGDGHGMVKIGGEVLDMFNKALPSIKNDLEKLGVYNDPNILFNMEYVSGKTNVQDYGSNFIAIHGLNKIESKEVEGKRGPLIKRVSSEISYDKSALQSLLDNLAPVAKEQGFEVYGSVPTNMTKKPNFNAALSKEYTVEAGENTQTKSLGEWLNGLNNIPEEDFIFMNVDYEKGSSTINRKKVGAVSKQVYLAILNGENVDGLFDDENDRKKAIQGFVTYLATEKLGDEILKVLDSPMGSVENHEGVVIRDEKITNIPFKITGKFILGGMTSDF